jgi:hypothetical protein
MFSLRATLLLIAILIIPYAIKSFLSIEPFPAVILPSGPGKTSVDVSEFELTTVSYYGISEDGDWNQVNAQKLLHPLHYPLQRYILSNEISKIDNSSIKIERATKRTLKEKLSRSKKNKFQANNELKELLRQRLASQGFKNSTLKILKQKVTISIPSGDTINSTFVNESILYLD